MLEDVRTQIYNNKTVTETELSKLESRLSMKIDEGIRNTEKYVSFIS